MAVFPLKGGRIVELTKLYRKHIENLLRKGGVEPDTVDIDHIWDPTLNFTENKNAFRKFIKHDVVYAKDELENMEAEANQLAYEHIKEEEKKEIQVIKETPSTATIDKIFW